MSRPELHTAPRHAPSHLFESLCQFCAHGNNSTKLLGEDVGLSRPNSAAAPTLKTAPLPPTASTAQEIKTTRAGPSSALHKLLGTTVHISGHETPEKHTYLSQAFCPFLKDLPTPRSVRPSQRRPLLMQATLLPMQYFSLSGAGSHKIQNCDTTKARQ